MVVETRAGRLRECARRALTVFYFARLVPDVLGARSNMTSRVDLIGKTLCHWQAQSVTSIDKLGYFDKRVEAWERS